MESQFEITCNQIVNDPTEVVAVNEEAAPRRGRAVTHSLVTNIRSRNMPAIRVEIIAASINFLSERLCLGSKIIIIISVF